MSDPFLHQVFVAGYAGELLEQSRKMKFGETGKTGEVIHIYIFGTVIGNIVAYIHEFFNIFMLFARGDAGKLFAGVKIGPADSILPG